MRRIEPVRRPVHGRLLTLLVLCVVGILFGCAAIQERVADSRFPDGLAPGPYFTKSGGATDRRYLKAGETLNNWTEMEESRKKVEVELRRDEENPPQPLFG